MEHLITLLKTIVWPIIIVIVLYYFKDIIINLLKAIVTRIEKGGFTVKIGSKTITFKQIEDMVKGTVEEGTLPLLWYNMGEIYRNLNKLEDAELMFKSAIGKNENFYQAYWGMGATYRDRAKKQGNDDQRKQFLNCALENCNKAIDMNREFAAGYLLRATIYLLQRKDEAAVNAELKRAIVSWPRPKEKPNMKDFIWEEETLKELRGNEWFEELIRQ